jgi:hypothetical protein
VLVSGARAEQQVSITAAGFSPNRLGVPVNAFGSAAFSSTDGRVPQPLTHVNIYGPPGVMLDLRGTGTCSAAALSRTLDPKVCPADSRAGFGGGIGVYELAHEIIEEKYTLDFFLSDNRPGHAALAIFLNGATPVSVQIVFTAVVIHSPRPYGLGLSIDVPIIKVLPEASDASAKTSFITLGAKNVAYYRRVHGRRKLFHVRGIVSPRTCPRGGWPVASQFTFQDGSTVLAKSTIPCPRRR